MGNTKVFSYGGVKLRPKTKIKPGTPKEAREIQLKPGDKRALAVALRDNLPCLLVGETGQGKTGAVRYLAHMVNQPYYRVNLDGHITPDELIGHTGAREGSTFYEEGVIIKAMREGGI